MRLLFVSGWRRLVFFCFCLFVVVAVWLYRHVVLCLTPPDPRCYPCDFLGKHWHTNYIQYAFLGQFFDSSRQWRQVILSFNTYSLVRTANLTAIVSLANAPSQVVIALVSSVVGAYPHFSYKEARRFVVFFFCFSLFLSHSSGMSYH